MCMYDDKYNGQYNYPHYLYFLRTKVIREDKNAFWDGYLKIGIATDLKERLKGIQTNCPYEVYYYKAIVMFSETSARLAEKALHNKFKKYQTIGEWFKYDSAISKWIEHKADQLGYDGLKKESEDEMV